MQNEYIAFDNRSFPFVYPGHISNVAADVVGLQECQDASRIATASGYSFLAASGNSNTILYKANRLEALRSGRFDVPSDVSKMQFSRSFIRLICGLIFVLFIFIRNMRNVLFRGESKCSCISFMA